MEKKGLVFDIQRCSMYDGPGIRTTVFLKGCPLSCKWCHNPESQSFRPQLGYFAEKCIGCGACEKICPMGCHTVTEAGHQYDPAACMACGRCAQVCGSLALKLYGKYMTAEEVFETVKKDKPYYGSTGGLTVSGGEPFAQPEFLAALLKLCKAEGIGTAIETSGCTDRKNLEAVLDTTDLFLYDYKLTDPEKHLAYTGVRNERILENLEFLYAKGKRIIIRGPVIPSVNADEAHFRGIAALERKYPGIESFEFLPYHSIGKSKADAIGKKYEIADPTVDSGQLDALAEKMIQWGCSRRTAEAFKK